MGGGDGGGGGFFGGGGGGKNKRGRRPKSRMGKMAGKVGNAFKGAGRGLAGVAGSIGSMGGGIMRGASKFGGAIAGVGLGAYEAVTGVMSAENKMENLEISAEEAQSQKGEAIGSGAGGAGGAMAGATYGATLGAIGGPVGMAVGGIIGGALGYFGGSWLGGKAGEALADAIPVDPGEIAESNEAALVALDKIEEVNPELRAEIEKQAEDNYQALLGDKSEDEYSDNDKAAMKNAGLVKAIQNKDEAIQNLQAEGANVDLSKLESTDDRKQAAVEQIAQEMGIDPSNVEAKVEMGKVTEINGQAVPEDLQKKSMQMMYPDSGAGQSNHPFLADAESGFEIPDEGVDRENFLIDYDLAKVDQQIAEKNLADFEAEHGEMTSERVVKTPLGGDSVVPEYEDPEVQAQFLELSEKNQLAKRERSEMLAQETDRIGGKTNDGKFEAIQAKTGMSKDEVLATIGGSRDGFSQGKLDSLLQVEAEKGLTNETQALYGRRAMAQQKSANVVDAGEPVPYEEIQAAYEAGKTGTTTSDSLEQGTMTATAAPGQPVPTGTALENMPSSQNAPAPVINNVTNNSGGGASKEPRVVVANAPTPRPNTNTIERYQDRRYRG